MIKLENTKRGMGVIIKGDYNDLNELYDAIYKTSDLYFTLISQTIIEDDDYSEEKKHNMLLDFEDMHDTILGLCYDIIHAYQGDRYVEIINESQYYGVDVLYPWMIYYLSFFRYVNHLDFDEDDLSLLMYPYSMIEYQKHKSLLNYFIYDIWQCLIDFIGKSKMMKLYEIASEDIRLNFLYDETYVEAFCFYYCDSNKKGKMIRKHMLSALIYESLYCKSKNDDYKIAVDKIKQTTKTDFLSLKKFSKDYWALEKIDNKHIDELMQTYGHVNWDNLKY